MLSLMTRLALEVADDCCSLLRVRDADRHPRPTHQCTRCGEEAIERLSVPVDARGPHCARIVGPIHTAGGAAEDAGQMRTVSVLTFFQAVTGGAALLEQALSICVPSMNRQRAERTRRQQKQYHRGASHALGVACRWIDLAMSDHCSALKGAGSQMDGSTDTLIGSTAAYVAAHRIIDVSVRGMRRLFQESDSGHDLPRLAVTALHDIECNPCLVHCLS